MPASSQIPSDTPFVFILTIYNCPNLHESTIKIIIIVVIIIIIIIMMMIYGCSILRHSFPFLTNCYLIQPYNLFMLKAVPQHTDGGERSYCSYPFTNSALDGGELSASRPGRALAPGKGPPSPIEQVAEWDPELVWT
jgi:hypothetical protein